MKKHLVMKASILLVVMFFHSFVLVPKSYATVWEGVVGRIAFRALAPSVIMGMSGGMGILAGVVIGGGIGYLLIKSGAISGLKTWIDNKTVLPFTILTGNGQQSASSIHPEDGSKVWNQQRVRTVIARPNGIFEKYYSTNGGGTWQPVAPNTDLAGATSWMSWSDIGSYQVGFPNDPMDYGTWLASSQPVLPSNTVYATPGTAAALVGGAAIVSAVQMSDADLDKFVVGLGATPVASDGTQAGNPPATTDNTVTAGDTASIGLLQQIVNWTSNLLGIKASTDAMKTTLDNSLIIQQQISAKLDNVGGSTFPEAAQSALDNIAAGTNAIPAKLDNVVQSISTATATGSTVQTRIDALKTAASTKFPFSLASSLSVSGVSGASTYEFDPLPLTPTISVQIDPMSGPLGSLFVWIRQMLVWFFWLGTLFAILKRGMEM